MNIDYFKEACTIAKIAGQRLKNQTKRTVNILTARDVKLQEDVESERFIKDYLEKHTHLPFIGEEEGGSSKLISSNELYWVVDPIDGTYNYLRGQSAVCVSIGLMRGLKPVAGAIYDINQGILYSGVVGSNVLINNEVISPMWAKNSDEACIMTGFPAASDLSNQALRKFIENTQKFKKVRMIGSAALAIANVAVGHADVYMENAVNLWDVAAGMALVEAAGGYLKVEPNENGNPLSLNIIAAGNKKFVE